MLSVFDFSNYRVFVKEFIDLKRLNNSKYSYSYYSRLISASEAYLKQVLAGRRKISVDKAKVLAKKMKLSPLESSYFITLVMSESAKTNELKRYFIDMLENLKRLRPIVYEDKNKFRTIFHNTLTWQIYTLLGSAQGKGIDVKKIKEFLKGNIKIPDIRKSLKQIDKLSANLGKSSGAIKTKDISLKHSDDLKEIYSNSLKRAIEYLEDNKQEEKLEHFDSFCLILGEDDFLKIQSILDETKSKINSVVAQSKDKSRIAFFNSNLFFVSKR